MYWQLSEKFFHSFRETREDNRAAKASQDFIYPIIRRKGIIISKRLQVALDVLMHNPKGVGFDKFIHHGSADAATKGANACYGE